MALTRGEPARALDRASACSARTRRRRSRSPRCCSSAATSDAAGVQPSFSFPRRHCRGDDEDVRRPDLSGARRPRGRLWQFEAHRRLHARHHDHERRHDAKPGRAPGRGEVRRDRRHPRQPGLPRLPQPRGRLLDEVPGGLGAERRPASASRSATRTTSSASSSVGGAPPPPRPSAASSQALHGRARAGGAAADRASGGHRPSRSSTRPQSAPNPVTGKRVTLVVDRYYLCARRQARRRRSRHAGRASTTSTPTG